MVASFGQPGMAMYGASRAALELLTLVARLAKELLGQPAAEQATAEYHLRTQVRPQILARRS